MCCYVPGTPFGDPEFQKSSQKTFTDCYLMRGFVGGQWSFALDGNDTGGVETGRGRVCDHDASGATETFQDDEDDGDDEAMRYGMLKKGDRRLAVYCLGWESAEVRRRRGPPPPVLASISLISRVSASMEEVPTDIIVRASATKQLHQAATKTPLFAEEIDKLAPYFGPGTGAFYVNFTKHG
ncbi:uncharacterized protein A1O9_04499 [Exophiala aquamarina CBS 119918]|uniref:Uncharacterized protein n=1 Tax=Exophiala aquamarina CBS 119918 TaxID=1182545 RepID=A0A072PK04_9EURO|nr:uncharacterized protein A1O9_04499 [Exophiala aquamarina CBS 119918]KEF59653.1 hypothetical protein A1O9_04499 [Exophiala aquamarina CBS 119918]